MKIIENDMFVCLVNDSGEELYKVRWKMDANERLIYVASPLSASTKEGIERNVEKALGYMNAVNNCKDFEPIFTDKVRVPYAPHAFVTKYLNDTVPEERALGIEFCNHMLVHANMVVWCGDTITKGMQAEIDLARESKKPIFHLPLSAV